MQQSPFENIFNIIGGLSQGNEKPMKHGFYNAFALLVLAACCAALYALFLILEPFFKPLFWALLVGSLLHPFKYRLSKQLKAWFDGLEKSNTSVIFGITIIPVNLVNYASNTIGSQFKEHYKLVLGLAFVMVVLPWAYGAVPRALICMFWQFISFFCVFTRLLISFFNSYIMLTVAVGYLVCVYTMWSPERATLFRRSSLLLWLCVSSYLAGLTGAFQVFVFVLLQLIGAAGFAVEVLDIQKILRAKDPEVSIFTSMKMALQNTPCQIEEERSNENPQNSPKHGELSPETPKTTFIQSEPAAIPTSNEKDMEKRRGLYKTHTLSSLPLNQTMLQYQNVEGLRKFRKSFNETDVQNSSQVEGEDETALYFKLLFFGCTCVLIWKQMWLLPLTLFFLSIYIIKKAGSFFGVWEFIADEYNTVVTVLSDWWDERSGAVVAAHVRGVIKLVSVCNRSIRSAAYDSVDTVSSCIVITALILFLLSASIFLCIQIYSEALVVVQLSSSVLNSSVVRDSPLWGHLPEGWEDSMDSLFDNAYTYGREGISKIVRGVLQEGEPEKVSRVEQQVLELWDRVYQSWMAGGFQSVGPQVDSSAVQDSWDTFVANITNTPGLFNYSGMVEWLKANVGTLAAIAGSVWAPLASNVSLLAGSLAALASVLLCGGTAILNFMFSSVVFFTTLFYLLASSGNLYKPVEVITQTQLSFGPRLGFALSVAINQVFRASFKMALFYGLWTWLVHNLFGAKVVYLPSGKHSGCLFYNNVIFPMVMLTGHIELKKSTNYSVNICKY